MTNLQFADGTELPLAATPLQKTSNISIEGVTGRTILENIQITPSETVTAENVKTLVKDSAKTSTIEIVTDSVVTGTFDNFTILVGGVTLDTTLIFTLAQRTSDEVTRDKMQRQISIIAVSLNSMDIAVDARFNDLEGAQS
jgi:hypothetical protein